MKAIRWGENDRYFGPFTVSRGDYYRTFAICLRSTDDEDSGASFRVSIGRLSLLSAMPKWLVRPERKKVYPKWDAATIARFGRDWYWEVTPREFGVSIFDGHLNITFGRVTDDSRTEQRWGCFLPWTQWRVVSNKFYDASGEFAFDAAGMKWDDKHRLREALSKAVFEIDDFDGQRIRVETHIEEAVHRRGVGLFRWLGYVTPTKWGRSLDIRFASEVGPEKGSYKGGLIGHSIEMLPGEMHAAAFRRYCGQDHRSRSRSYRIKFVSAVGAL